ncbi:Fur family transcriptional regulator [Anaerocolumna chitinilytica]|uniref:Transcriptional repressor n=1 Tax=Anaerocolumna chitinilytica TaxID=1727145 RepID=A0A7I8DRZ9_9FIRM|nr:Fur family transcriptional regulator [Anaerocolumna chitinilytica]BCK00022.1 transcriptional repressor [Anaerocolumna chitinilytica]
MPDKKDRFKMLLKEKGLKVTTQRVDILEALEIRPDKHLTAEEIYEIVKEKNPDIGLATVYRTIQLLAELNLIDKLNLGDGYVRYEIGNMDEEQKTHHHHHHLICLGCGNVLTFQGDLLDTLEGQIQKTMGFEVVDHEVKMYGYCKDCAAERGKE